ncbi:MAG: ABC transporter permease [bacterium]|nr:ABC transporter permease [bacterium]
MGVIRSLLKYDKRFTFGFFIIVFIIFLSILSFFSPYDPSDRYIVPRDRPPNLQYILGTTSLGQDVFWYLTIAIRNSLIIGLISVSLSRLIATTIGLVSGYLGGNVDSILTTLVDSFNVIPRLPILVLISFAFRGYLNFLGIGLLLAFFDWAWPSKRYRSQILSLREREFTNTAIFSGRRTLGIILKEHVPFLLPYIMADFISGFLWAIGMQITLSILGLFNLDIPTIGTMIYWANYYQSILKGTWWWIGSPIVALILTVMSFYFLSVSLSSYLDPRLRVLRVKEKTE